MVTSILTSPDLRRRDSSTGSRRVSTRAPGRRHLGIGEKTRARRRQTRVSRRRGARSRRIRRSRHAAEGITHRAPGPMLNRRHHGGRAAEDVSMKGIPPNLRPWIRKSTTQGVSETVNGGTKCGISRNRTEEPHRKAARGIRRHSRLPMKGWSGGRGRRGAILLVAQQNRHATGKIRPCCHCAARSST